MEKSNEKISNKDLEKVSGGFKGMHDCQTGNTSISVTQEEYDCLVDGGYIVDGKCETGKWWSAVQYLKEKGYEGWTGVVGGDLDPFKKRKPIDKKDINPYISFEIAKD